jgi:hypothetical protein
MRITRLVTGLLLIVVGPAVTVYLYRAVNVSAGLFSLIVVAAMMSGITAGVSTAAHLMRKGRAPATAASVLVSEVLYVLLLLTYIFCMSASRGRAESVMWLPVLIPFLIVLGLPTALSVSCGTGMIVMNFADGADKRSWDVSRSLIESEEKRTSEKSGQDYLPNESS